MRFERSFEQRRSPGDTKTVLSPLDLRPSWFIAPRNGRQHLTPPRRPQSNSIIERFNGRIADTLRTHRAHHSEQLESTMLRYAWLYNHHLSKKALDCMSSIQSLKESQATRPESFHEPVGNHPG